MNILSGNVGDVFLKTVSVLVQNDASLQFLRMVSKSLRTEKQSKLQRHVEARQCRFWVELCSSADIVNAVATVAYDLAYFFEAILRTIVCLERAACLKARP